MKTKTVRMLTGLAMKMKLLTAAVATTVLNLQAGVTFTSLHNFGVFPNGTNPNGLVQGTDGNLYGTTPAGGTNGGWGTVFKITPSGALTTLYSFTDGADGWNPAASLVQGSDGNFYGTTYSGGSGTVFRISPGGNLTTLYSFTGGDDGGGPQGALVQGSDSSFYGTTAWGGTGSSGSVHGVGTVFKISAGGMLTTLHSFIGGDEGWDPEAGLVQGSDGDLYGTTWGGGASDQGTIFKISPSGVLTTLYSFTGGNDGGYPYAGLFQGSDGIFYGTSSGSFYGAFGGPSSYAGTVFKITTNGVLTTLYSFTGSVDGGGPSTPLVQGADGNFYGTTTSTVFKISAGGAFTVVYSFTNDGAAPSDRLMQASDGNLYGTTQYGGTDNAGTVFKINTNGGLTSMYSFTGGSDGAEPVASLVQGTDGNLYSTTYYGGTNNAGTVFKISTNGTFTSLYSFTHGADGEYPYLGLMQTSDGDFYGATEGGGNTGGEPPFSPGTVFRVGSNGALTTLYSFTGSNDGEYPYSVLVQGSDGKLYGTTFDGGANGDGTVFQITTNGALTTLYSFSGNDGANPPRGLVQGNDGNFYGATQNGGTNGGYGTVFKITTNGTLTSLYSFNGNDGSSPNGLVQGSDGDFYGTTAGGGTNGGYGTVFKITASGTLTSLHSFNGNDGSSPPDGLVQGSDGSFYGTTYAGGANGAGTVFRLSAGLPQLGSSIAIPIDAAFGFTNRTFGFDVSGPPGSTVIIQASTDLRTWIPVQTNLIDSRGLLQFSDSQSPANPQRFYRAVLR